jgi:CBS domain containing-hemolysin-like protein
VAAVLIAVISLIGVILLTVGTALFVAAEFSLVAADRAELENAARSGDRAAGRAVAAMRTLSFQLSGAQLGITITTLAVGFLAEPSITRLLRPVFESIGFSGGVTDVVGVIVALATATLLQMVLGELIPKNWAIARPTQVARLIAAPMHAFTRSLRFLISACNRMANAIVRRFGIEPQEELRSARSPAELSSLVRASAAEGTLPGATANLLARSLGFGELVAGEVMTPRTRMIGVDADASVADVLTLARASGRSRFPLGDTDGDGPRQLVRVKTAIAVPAAERATTLARELAEPLPEVPESLPLQPLLQLLRRPGSQLALVVDEWGGIAGLVALEDVLEELVGDVDDEHDAPSSSDYRQSDGSLRLPGLLRVDQAAELLGIELPSGPFDTVGGLFMSRLGRVAEVGDTVDLPGVTLTVASIDGRRIDALIARPRADDAGTGEST